MAATHTGLAIIGANRLAAHVAAIESVSSLCVIGRARGETDTTGRPGEETPEQMLRDPRVGAVAVLTRAEDREYWIRQAAACGKHIVCEQPVVSSSDRAIKLSNHCRDNGVRLYLAKRFAPEPEQLLRESMSGETTGPVVFLALDVFVPKGWVSPGQRGVVLEYGAPFAHLLEDCFGPIDTIYARTRSLVTNRPQEDVAVVQLRFRNGVEGILQVNALGSHASTVRIAAYGTDGSSTFEVDLLKSDASGLRSSYEELGRATAAIEQGALAPSSTVLFEGLFIVDWIHQSARHNIEVTRRDARRG